MLTDEIEDAETTTTQTVRARYEREVADAVETVGVDDAAAATDVERDRLDALVAGDAPRLTLSEAASLLALAGDAPDADAILAAVRDHVMLQMSSAVVDVDALAAGLDGDLDPKEIQQKIEGRQPMTLAEYAQVHRFLAAENPF
jgi:hypothetical protein